MNQVGQDIVNPVEQGNHGHDGNGDRCEDDKSLQKVLKSLPQIGSGIS